MAGSVKLRFRVTAFLPLCVTKAQAASKNYASGVRSSTNKTTTMRVQISGGSENIFLRAMRVRRI